MMQSDIDCPNAVLADEHDQELCVDVSGFTANPPPDSPSLIVYCILSTIGLNAVLCISTVIDNH